MPKPAITSSTVALTAVPRAGAVALVDRPEGPLSLAELSQGIVGTLRSAQEPVFQQRRPPGNPDSLVQSSQIAFPQRRTQYLALGPKAASHFNCLALTLTLHFSMTLGCAENQSVRSG